MRGFSGGKARTRLAVFCLGSSALTLAGPAGAAVIDYPNGSTNTSPIVLTDNSTQLQVLTGSATQSGVISETGPSSSQLEKIGAGTLIFTADNTYTGPTIISAGTLQLGNGGSTGSIVGGFAQINNSVLILNHSGTFNFNQTIDGTGSVIFAGTGTTVFTGNIRSNQVVTVSSGTLQIGNGSVNGFIDGSIVNNSLITVLGTSNFNGMSGTGQLQVNGPGVTTILGADTRTGNTVVTGGTLRIGGNTIGSLSGDIVNNAVVQFARSDTVTYAGVISGSGSVQQTGIGTLILTGANTFTGDLVNTSIVQIGNGTTGTLAANVINSGTLTFNRLGTYTYAGVISSGGQVTFNTNATAILTGANTYTGGTTINGSTVQIGNGGTTGSIVGNVGGFGTLAFNRSDSLTFGGVISGNMTVRQDGPGTTILTGANTYAFGTVVNAGTLQLGTGGKLGASSAALTVNGGTLDLNNTNQTVGAVTGTGGRITLGSGTLTVTGNTGGALPSVISGTGGVLISAGQLKVTAENTYTGGTVVTGTGALQIGDGGASGSVVGNITNNSILVFNRSDSYISSNVISGSGKLIQQGNGTLILTGTNSYTGGTQISSGPLQVGNGGTTGSIIGNVVTGGAGLVFNRFDAVTFSGVISGTGNVAQSGSGTVTLSGTSTYTGGTTINAGTLNITGAIASSKVSVANGGTLAGTGKAGTTTVAGGGTVMAGSGGTPGTLTVSGNLTLASGANFVDFVTPSSAGLVTASGTASINGNVTANFAAGSYAIGQRFTLLTATGGLSGTFVSLNTLGLPTLLKGRLSYDANNAYLNLDPNALTPQLSNATGNQSSVAKAIDTALAGSASLPAGFQALFNLSGPALNSALDQVSGQIGPNAVNGAGQSFQAFLSLMGQGGDGGSGFAPGNAYGNAGAPHRAQLGAGQMRVWGAAYGGHVGLSADPVSGAASLSGTNAGLVGGVDMQVQDGLLLGATLGWGSQDFRSGNGTGTSEDVAIGIYGRHEDGPLYVSAALGYGWHHIKTLRTVTVSGTDVLQGIQDATDFGGRLEAGWHLALDKTYAITPYAAFMGDSLESPAYAETAVSGASTFALAAASHTDALGRVEAGARLNRDFVLDDATLAAGLQAAWAHQINDAPLTQATFLGLSGANFVVAGVRPARDAALLGASLEMRERSGFFFGVRGESLLGSGTTTIEGMGDLGWHW